MTAQPYPIKLADECPESDDPRATQWMNRADAELRRLHEAHDWQYKMAGERLRRIEKLEALNQELVKSLQTIAHISLMDKGHWAKTIETEALEALAKVPQ